MCLMRRLLLFVAIAALTASPLPVSVHAQQRSQAQSQAEDRPQSNSQAQSQATSQSLSQSQSQATSQTISQQETSQQTDKPQPAQDMNMSGHAMPGSPAAQEMPGMGEGAATAMQSMEGHHMDMGPHMKMTALRDPKPGDAERAAQVVIAARKAAEKYTDYKTALADGYEIFMPNVPQKQYHFTNYRYAFEAAFHFDPDRPTSLLYQKQGDGYKLIGVMYTARKNSAEDDLDERIPLSVAQWHAHVNVCLPPNYIRGQALAPNPQFGLRGSIATKEACDATGGRFMPQIFGWMVHVYPFEQKQEDIWSVERQHQGNNGHMD